MDVTTHELREALAKLQLGFDVLGEKQCEDSDAETLLEVPV